MRSATASSPAPRSTCSPPSPRPSRRCSSSTASSSPRTSVRPPARRRTRPATRSPTWCSWPWPATSCRSPSTSNAAEANETLRPFLPLAERLGRLFASLVGTAPRTLEVCTEGDIAGYDTRILTLAVLKGFFGAVQRRAGHLRQRAAAGQGPRRRGARDQLRHRRRLRQPGHRARRRALDLRARSSAAAASSAS